MEVLQMYFDVQAKSIVGEHGMLAVVENDSISRRLAMLIEGECEGIGAIKTAEKYGITKQRYYQIRDAYRENGAIALSYKTRGPKTNYRRTDELQRQVIRHRFLDPAASADIIAQKLRQTGFDISTRSVERVIAEYGLQKKTL
jgi:transposase